MPLIHSKSDSAFKANVRSLMHDIGKSPHVKNQKQALAIAYATKRRGRAAGGAAPDPQDDRVAATNVAKLRLDTALNERPAGNIVNVAPGSRARAHGGVAGFALGGPQAPWQVKAEARGMMHTGPINSVVPGRTDNHKMSVPGGAYVVNADTVSHIGQNNTNAGQAILSHMFGQAGPYGMGHDMGIKHGSGAPRPPAMGKIPADTGGSRGSNSVGQPVPVMTAGGEFVIHPDIVARVGGGDLKRGHAVLDKWMTDMRKEHIRTLKKLPGPAKG